MKSGLILLVGLLGLVLTPAGAAANPKAVVEIFTSQGCSSCRSADVFFAQLAERNDLLALSFHVDYWDYLGWKDTFGLPENTARQAEYAKVLGSRRIYTPQIVVNGMVQLVGSDKAAVESAIASARFPIAVEMRKGGGAVHIEVGARSLPSTMRTMIRLVLFSSLEKVSILRGENAGVTLQYRNIVRGMRPIGMWDGGAVRITLPENELIGDEIDGCAVIVQEELPNGPGAILGAAKLEW